MSAPENHDQALGLAYELGVVAATNKFAMHQEPVLRDRILACVGPDHVELARCFAEAHQPDRS